jgi:hypothetical protein
MPNAGMYDRDYAVRIECEGIMPNLKLGIGSRAAQFFGQNVCVADTGFPQSKQRRSGFAPAARQ